MCVRTLANLRKPKATGKRTLCLVGDSLRITEGDKVSYYLLTEIGSDVGRGWRVIGNRGTYETHLGAQGAAHCTCPGFEHGYLCRHVAALAACVETGKIPGGIPMPGDF